MNNRNYKDSVFVDYFDKDEKTDKSFEIIVKVFNIIKYKEITGFLDCIKAECNAKLFEQKNNGGF